MPTRFSDRSSEPTAESIRDALASASGAWDELIAALAAAGAPVAWRYYRDGGWLAKAAAGGRTIAWLSVEEGSARITFTFAERHRAVLANTETLPEQLRRRLADAPLSGRILPVSLEIRDTDDVALAEAVLRVKLDVR